MTYVPTGLLDDCWEIRRFIGVGGSTMKLSGLVRTLGVLWWHDVYNKSVKYLFRWVHSVAFTIQALRKSYWIRRNSCVLQKYITREFAYRSLTGSSWTIVADPRFRYLNITYRMILAQDDRKSPESHQEKFIDYQEEAIAATELNFRDFSRRPLSPKTYLRQRKRKLKKFTFTWILE